MDNELMILLEAKLNESKSISNISSQIKTIQKGLAGLEIKLDLGDFKKQLEKTFGEFEKVTKKMNSSTNVGGISGEMEKYRKSIADVTHEYKLGLKTQTEYINAMQKAVYDSNGGYGGKFLSLEMKEQERLVNDINVAVKARDQALKTEHTTQTAIGKELEKQEKAYATIQGKKEALKDITVSHGRYDNNEYEGLIKSLDELERKLKAGEINVSQFRTGVSKLNPEIKQFEVNAKAASNTTNDFSDKLSRFVQFYVVGEALRQTKKIIRDMVEDVKALDHSMVELQKVSDLSGQSLEDFKNKAFVLGDAVAKTGKDVLDGATEFKRAGFTIEESLDLSGQALKMTTVADGIDNVTEASSSLIAVLKGFKFKDIANDTAHIIDAFNEVSNTQAINYDDLAEGMTRISGVMAQQGNSMEESIGLITGAFTTLRNIEKSSSGILMITQRLQGLDEVTGEIDTELVAKMGEEFERLAGIKLTDTNGQMRDTYGILEDMAKIFPTLDKNTRSYLTQLAAGKRQSSVLQAILDNWKEVEEATKSALNSQGSSAKEQLAYLDSIEGKTNRLKSAMQSLADTTINSDFIKWLIDATTWTVKLIDALGGLIPLLTGLSGVLMIIKASSIASVITSITGAFSALGATLGIVGAGAATAGTGVAVATTGLAAAIPVIGLVVVAVGALTAGLSYLSKSGERAKQKIEDLKGELSDIQSEIGSSDIEVGQIKDLSSQYDELKKLKEAQGLSNEQQQEFTRIQNEIKQIMPEVNGYFDSQNNFVLDQSTSMESLNRQMAEFNENLRIQRAEKAQELSGELLKNQEEEKKNLDELIRYRELYNKSLDVKWGTKAWGELDKQMKDMIKESPGLIHNIKGVENLDSAIESLKSTYAETEKSIDDSVLSMMAGTEEWTALTNEQEDAIRRILSGFGHEDNQYLARSFENGSLAIGEYVEHLRDGEKAQRYMQEAIDDANGSVEFHRKTLEEIEETVSKLSKAYKESSTDIEQLEKAMDELNEIHDLTNETRNAMIEKYPELLGLIGDEAAQREFLSAKIQEQEEVHRQSLLNMLEYDQEFYKNRILGSEENSIAIRSFYQDMVDGLGLDYQVDLDNFTTLASLKEDIAAQSASNIRSLWSELSYNGMAMGQMSHAPDFSLDDILPNNNFAPKGISKRSISAKKTGGSKSKSGSSSKEDLPKYITQGYDDISKEILAKSDKLEREISQQNARILNAQLLGNTEEELALQTQLESMYDKRIEFEKEKSVALIGLRKKVSTELGKQNFDVLKGINLESITEKQLSDINRKLDAQIDKANKAKNDKLANSYKVQQDMINEHVKFMLDADSNINSISLNVRELENENIEKTIALIERKYELEDKLINDRIRDIDVELLLTKDGSEDQLRLQKQKYDEQLNIQNNYLKKIKEYREQEIEMDAEVIQKQMDGWYNAERERLNMLKSMGEQAKKLKLDTLSTQQTDLNEAQKATQTLVDMVIKMLKQQYAEEKALIQENSKAKEDSIKKELDGYKKVIEAKKSSLREEKDNKDYDKELKAKQKSVADIENKILVLSNDNSKKAQAERLKLEEEKLNLIDELNEFQENRSIELQEKALDEELARYEEAKNEELKKYKDQKDKELKILDDYLSKEGNLRAEAIRLIENKNRDLYNKLIRWNEDYGTGIRDDVSDAWDSAYEAMKTYGDGQNNVLTTLKNIVNELKNVKLNMDEINNSSWQDFVDQDDISPDKSKFPVYDTEPDKKPSGGSTDNTNKKYTEAEAKKIMQQNEQKYLHGEMVKAINSKNEGQIKALKAERNKWGLDPDNGTIWQEGKVPDEYWKKNKAKYGFMKGGTTSATGLHWLDGTPNAPEMVLSSVQTKSFTDLVRYLPNVINKIETFEGADGKASGDISLTFENLINVEGNLDESVDINDIIKKAKQATIEAINKVLEDKGIKPRGGRLAMGRL